MSAEDKEGTYCSICGGISPGKVTTRQILVNGKEIGINKLDDIIAEVRALRLSGEPAIVAELLRRAKLYNYVPTSRSNDYGEALLKEYQRSG